MEHSLALRLRRPLRIAVPRRRVGRLLAVALLLALLGGGWLWFRGSSFAAVREVRITGVQGADAGRVQAALSAAARGMSTLDVDVAALRAAVAPLRVVSGLGVSTSFPHTLRIRVSEQLPVAEVVAAGGHTAVAADGVVLGPALLVGGLPSIHVGGLTPRPGEHVRGLSLQAQLRVLGAAPHTLLGWVLKVFDGPEGLTVALRGGVQIYFGDAARADAKWLAAARVLADPRSAGATYVDVRLPERPAAGTDAPGGMPDAVGSGGDVSASDPSSAALAAVLDEAVSGSSGVATSLASSGASTGGAATSSTPSTGGEASAATTSTSVSEPVATASQPSATGEQSAGGGESTEAAAAADAPGSAEASTTAGN